jgi:small GTP-binding protein
MVEAAAERKQKVRALLERLAGLAEGLGLASTAREIRDDRMPKLDEERLLVVVLGEFNRGKSTLVNALVGRPVLPVGITPTTAALTHVRHGKTLAAELVRDGGRREAVDPARLEALVAAEPGGAPNGVDHVEVRVPAPWLGEHVTLVDTPGVNDLSDLRADITYGYVPRADAVLFLLDATQVLTASERRFLEERVLRSCRDRMVFVVSKSDLVTPEELEQAVAFARRHLATLAPEAPLFPVAAKRALPGRDGATDAGLGALRAHLEKSLGAERRRLVLDHALADASRLAAFLRQGLAMRRRSLELPLADLEERTRRAEAQLAAGRQALAAAAGTVRTEAAGLKARVRQDLAAFTADLTAALPREIDAAEAADVERYLGGFLQDVWRRWLEAEGETLAGELERIAEAVLAVASESAAALADKVAAEVEVAPSRLELHTSSFKYDASVFALGALGTTVFLFVNTLVGGLLALSAPIAALLLRGRVAQEIKAEAKDRAPEAARKIAATLGPKLDEVVDGFAGRLEVFIVEAGAALARGIAEVLEGALAERRRLAEAAETASSAAGLDGALASLKAIDEEIAELRQGVWLPA